MGPAGYWCIIETPNRLWYTDQHTSLLPFFHWLPDDLAFQSSRFSARENFKELYSEATESSMIHFLRRGRGVSFHDPVVAFGSAESFQVVSYLQEFLDKQGRNKISNLDSRYFQLLLEIMPSISPAFFQENLELVLKKSAPAN